MDRIAIVGGAPLNGSIPISGAKNSAIKLMAASLLTDQPLRLTNMPRLADTRFLARLLRRLGTEVTEIDGADGPETLPRRSPAYAAGSPKSTAPMVRRPCCIRRRSSRLSQVMTSSVRCARRSTCWGR